jgi:hypothetical protein
MKIVAKDDQYILNHCTKFLARHNSDARHNFGQYDATDLRARICEAWRFPIIDSYLAADDEDGYAFNKVTFVYHADAEKPQAQPCVIGTFANLYDPVPLLPVRFFDEPTEYLAVSVRVPKGQIYRYKFVLDGTPLLDPVNPQKVLEANGEWWSRFFTHLCTQPLSFETWEFSILERLVDHIMPFQTDAGQNFLQRFYNDLDKQDKETQYAFAYRLDQPIGIVNFIDNLVAREEYHHLIDYKICLRMIARIVRQRMPSVEPAFAPKEIFIELYGEMASGKVTGWDNTEYGNPAYFLQILRRHAYTGAFSHPKYGGNVGALGWQYLGDRFKDAAGATLFDWSRSIEPPLGVNPDYRG